MDSMRRKEVESSCDIFQGSIKPVFKYDCKRRPYHSGTAFGLIANEIKYFVTALHVAGKDEANPCDSPGDMYCFCNQNLIKIPVESSITISIDSAGEMDVMLIDCVKACICGVFDTFISQSDISNSKFHSNDYWCAIGYPSTKNKIVWNTAGLTQKPYAYYGTAVIPTMIRRFGYTEMHVGLEIDLKRVIRSDQFGLRAPDPSGISGGPIFCVDNLRALDPIASPKLVGIVTDRQRDGNAIIGLSIPVIVDILSDKSSQLPTSD